MRYFPGTISLSEGRDLPILRVVLDMNGYVKQVGDHVSHPAMLSLPAALTTCMSLAQTR